MSMSKWKISSKLFASFFTVIFIFILICIFQIMVMKHLKVLEDESAGRSKDAIASVRVAMQVDALYGIIADSIINRSSMETREDYKRKKLKIEIMVVQLEKMADTKEENAWAGQIKSDFGEYFLLYERQMLPALAGNDMERIRRIDEKIVSIRNTVRQLLRKYTESLLSENRESAERYDSAYSMTVFISLALSVVGALVALALAFLLTRYVRKQIVQVRRLFSESVNNIETGNLKERVSGKGLGVDFQDFAPGINRIMDAMLAPIKDIIRVLEMMSRGKLDVSMKDGYQGDFARIKKAVDATLQSLNVLLRQVKQASEQVADGANQISSTSQTLSQGSSEQASSLSETTTAITELSSQTQQMAGNSVSAGEKAGEAVGSAETGNVKMNEMLTSMTDINRAMREINQAMNEISGASKGIAKIIKTIDEIAFQTNLLALNAAVEAARAGKYGKGFAVVAEEVRNLASRSASAARETTEIIEESIEKMEVGAALTSQGAETAENGSQLAEETSVAFKLIVERINEAMQLVSEITAASEEQAKGIAQIELAMIRVDQVTQQNAAIAEEAAAASEELASQSIQLNGNIEQFKLAAVDENGKKTGRDVKAARGKNGKKTGRNVKAVKAVKVVKGGNGARGEIREQKNLINVRSEPKDIIKLGDNEFEHF